jgi:hypothetical protein
MKTHFWFSQKQRNASCGLQMRALTAYGSTFDLPVMRNFARIGGKIVEYTLMSACAERPDTDWDDLVYLGQGVWDHAEPTFGKTFLM